MGAVAYIERPQGAEVETAHGYVALLETPVYPVIVAPRRLYIVRTVERPLAIGGLLYNRATGALLYNSLTGAALFA